MKHFIRNAPGYAAGYLRVHDQSRAFVLLHDAMYQPKGAVAASAALTGDTDPARVAMPALDPDATPAKTTSSRKQRAPKPQDAAA